MPAFTQFKRTKGASPKVSLNKAQKRPTERKLFFERGRNDRSAVMLGKGNLESVILKKALSFDQNILYKENKGQ